jgi:hypothetical protein
MPGDGRTTFEAPSRRSSMKTNSIALAAALLLAGAAHAQVNAGHH